MPTAAKMWNGALSTNSGFMRHSFFFKIYFILIEESREKEREQNIDCFPSASTSTGDRSPQPTHVP